MKKEKLIIYKNIALGMFGSSILMITFGVLEQYSPLSSNLTFSLYFSSATWGIWISLKTIFEIQSIEKSED